MSAFRRRIKGNRNNRQQRAALTGVSLLVALLCVVYLVRNSARYRSCGSLQIWSHRGHLDSFSSDNKSWSCQHALGKLRINGIHHLDIDILFHEGRAIVAHPTEMGNDLGSFSPSPCSKIPLVEFLTMLKSFYGERFYVTMEPKSAWTEEGPFLSPPEKVIGGILDVLDGAPVPHRRCGIILDPSQAQDSRIVPLVHRIQQHCAMVTPLRRNLSPLDEKDVPPKSFQVVMPAIELFGGVDGAWWMKKTQSSNQQVVAWIIDTKENLRKALRLGVQGVISNHPVRLKEHYAALCGSSDTKLSLDI